MADTPHSGTSSRKTALPSILLPVFAAAAGPLSLSHGSAALHDAKNHYAAPAGSPRGDGSRENPWDLTTALAQPSSVKPGETVWLRGGIYGSGDTQFTSTLTGAPGSPIIVRGMPGEKVVIDGGLVVNGSDAWYRDFEVSSSLTGRTGDTFERIDRAPPGFFVNGPRTRFINLVVHDTAQGFGLWKPALDAEIYGCLIYHNGWQGADRGHGHGIYTQNDAGTKRIEENIIFNQFDLGIQAYGSSNATVKGYDIAGNAVFNNGIIAKGRAQADNILLGYPGALERIRVVENFTYHTPSNNTGYSRLGWEFGGVNRDLDAEGNYWIGGYISIGLWKWQNLTYRGNVSYAPNGIDLALAARPDQNPARYTWARNTYYGSGRFLYDGSQNWDGWRSVSGLDKDGRYVSGRPHGSWTFVRPNKYEHGRANVIIYNWDLTSTVDVDVSRVLNPGMRYQIRDAENFSGAPLISGIWNGRPVRIPMTGLRVAAPRGEVPSPPVHTAPEFGVFVILPL